MSMDVGAVGSNQQVYNQQGYDISKKNEEKLSTKAQKYLADLRKQYGDYDIVVGNRTDDMQALAKGQGKDTTVIFSNADIERMAVDKKFADEKMQGVAGSVKMAHKVDEENAKGAVYEPGKGEEKKATYSINKGVEDYQNVFGSSVASAMQAARELLYDLENPLTPISERGENAREYIEQEKEFYKKFIENLEEISNILVGDENNMHINKELAQKYSSQLKPVDDIAAVLKQPMQLASRKQLNKASNSIDIALGTNVKVPGGFTLVVKEYGVEVQGVTNWNNQKESQDASDMAGALATLLRNASGQLQHVGTDSRQITQWNEDVEKVLGYFGIDISRDFTVNGVKYVRDGSGIHKAAA